METSSYDINKAYDYMKKMLADLPSVVETSKVESFTLFPYPDPDPYPSQILRETDKQFLAKYKIIPKEVYSVIDKFDLHPKVLQESDKELRKKYLKILIDVVKNEIDVFKGSVLAAGENGPASNPFFLSNVDPAASLIARIADLLLLEIDPIVCPSCPTFKVCPSCDDNAAATMIAPSPLPYIGVIVILIISILIMFFMRK